MGRRTASLGHSEGGVGAGAASPDVGPTVVRATDVGATVAVATEGTSHESVSSTASCLIMQAGTTSTACLQPDRRSWPRCSNLYLTKQKLRLSAFNIRHLQCTASQHLALTMYLLRNFINGNVPHQADSTFIEPSPLPLYEVMIATKPHLQSRLVTRPKFSIFLTFPDKSEYFPILTVSLT